MLSLLKHTFFEAVEAISEFFAVAFLEDVDADCWEEDASISSARQTSASSGKAGRLLGRLLGLYLGELTGELATELAAELAAELATELTVEFAAELAAELPVNMPVELHASELHGEMLLEGNPYSELGNSPDRPLV
jgi:hypothetical protein